MILELSIAVFITQLIFIGCRTWNVRAIANKDIKQVLLSGAIVHISWLVGITIGTVSMTKIMSDFQWQYIPIIIASLSGGLLGSYIGLKDKIKKQ
jgi:hypothetical protein